MSAFAPSQTPHHGEQCMQCLCRAFL